MKKLSTLLAVAALLLVSIQGCKKDDHDHDHNTNPGSIELSFDNVAGSEALVFGNVYVNEAGEQLTFNKLLYYVSNVKLVKTDGTEYEVPKDSCYFLIDHSVAASRTVTINNVPAGSYSGVKFIIGVDSLKSTTDISQRTGSLDPAGAAAEMYWSWNSGYIFVKCEGTSPQAPLDTISNTRPFFYHIGGYGGYSSPALNNIKNASISNSGEAAEVAEGNTPEMHIKVDILQLFKSPTTLSVATHPDVMFGPMSATIADNYKDMFTLDHIHN